MSGPTHSIQTTYRPVEGNGTIRITFPDVRKSSRKNADELVNKQIAKITEDHPGKVITAHLERGERFASIWIYALTTQPAPAVTPAPETT
jgi:hypothetical protein